MPTRWAACAHWCFRCSVGVTTVTDLISRRASSSAATVKANAVLPAPGVATSRKSRRGRRKYSLYAACCQARRPLTRSCLTVAPAGLGSSGRSGAGVLTGPNRYQGPAAEWCQAGPAGRGTHAVIPPEAREFGIMVAWQLGPMEANDGAAPDPGKAATVGSGTDRAIRAAGAAWRGRNGPGVPRPLAGRAAGRGQDDQDRAGRGARLPGPLRA